MGRFLIEIPKELKARQRDVRTTAVTARWP